MWWCRDHVSEIVVDRKAPEFLKERMDRLRHVDLEGHLFDISTDLRVPTVFAVIRGARVPYFVVGAACHEDPATACAKALDEAVSGRVASRFKGWTGTVSSLTGFDWVQRLEHHMLLYANWRDTPGFEFLLRNANDRHPFEVFANQDWMSPPTTMTALKKLAVSLKGAGLDVLWADLTSEEAEPFGTVVKVFIPQMVPLSQDHRVRWLASPRLNRRRSNQAATGDGFNPLPHPFA